MSLLSLYGFAAITFMLVCYLLEHRSAWWTLAFSVGCLWSSSYGFLQGAWPFGAVELLWAGIALRRWVLKRHEPLA